MTNSTQVNIRQRVEFKFKAMLQMVGNVRVMIVAGTPGIGKSYGIIGELEKQDRKIKTTKAGMSAIGLYIKLWETRTDDFTLVIDDSDNILNQREGIDLLKASFDTNAPRSVQWNKQNTNLEKMGIKKQFEYNGHIIFITNLDLKNAKPKSRQLDFDTLTDRAHYHDLELNSLDERLMRCQIVLEGGVFLSKKGLSISDRGMLFEYLKKYGAYFNNVSLRTLEKLEDIKLFSPNWEEISAATLMDNAPADAYETFHADGSGAALIQAGQPQGIVKNDVDGGGEEHIDIEVFGDIHSVPKGKYDLAFLEHEENVRRLEIIDNFFLKKPLSKLAKITIQIGDEEEDTREVLEPIRFKESLSISQNQATELYDFILKIMTELDRVTVEELETMVKFYKVAGSNWKQGVLALFIRKGVTINVQKKS